MDWTTFWIILAQVGISSLAFMIVSIPLAWGVGIIRRAFHVNQEDRGIFHGPDRG